ncbi:hypothetical protein YC2023_044526 [Brassica napus]
MPLTTKTQDESIESVCLTTAMWETLEKERLMGFRVFTRGIWYALTIFSCFGLLIYGKQVLVYPIRFGVTAYFAVMLLRCLFFVERPSPNFPVQKYNRFVTSLIILPFMFYVPFNYPTMDVFISIFSLLAGGISIYQLSCTMDIGHALLLLFLAFANVSYTHDMFPRFTADRALLPTRPLYKRNGRRHGDVPNPPAVLVKGIDKIVSGTESQVCLSMVSDLAAPIDEEDIAKLTFSRNLIA